jgi:methylthioribose-1-phosphate isomerase
MVLAAGASIEPWTWDGDRLLLLDARRLPGAGPAFAVTSASSSARAIAARVVSGPTAAALAAWGLAFATEAAAGREATTGAALLRGSRSSMLAADPGSWVLRRTLATLPDAPGRGDAAAVTARLRTAHQTLAARLAGVLRDAGIRAPLLHGECGPLWGAGSGVGVEAIVGLLAGAPGPEVAPAVPPTADVAPGEVAAAARAAPAAPPSATTGAAVWVTEGRPWLTGARVTAWELGRLGCAATVVPDAAAATVLLERRVDALVMVAERSALDGTLALPVGALGLAVAAARARIPVIVARPDWALDPDARDAADLAEPPVADAALTHLGGTRITPPDAAVHAPRLDRVPADLVTHLVDQGAPTA